MTGKCEKLLLSLKPGQDDSKLISPPAGNQALMMKGHCEAVSNKTQEIVASLGTISPVQFLEVVQVEQDEAGSLAGCPVLSQGLFQHEVGRCPVG